MNRGREKRKKLKKVLKSGGRGFLEGTGLVFLAQNPSLGHLTKRLGGPYYEQLHKRLEQRGITRSMRKQLPWIMGSGMAAYRTGRAIADEYMLPPIRDLVQQIRQKVKAKKGGG